MNNQLLNQLITSVIVLTVMTSLLACGNSTEQEQQVAFSSKQALGESLFADKNLSLNRTQSCATCHNPERAFIDDRLDANGDISAVSLGDDGVSLGDRNTPTAAYAQFSPEFHIGNKSRFNSQQPDYQGPIGGQFVDGRESDLAGQASAPPLNPIEMAMPDKAAVVARILENSDYADSFKQLFGETLFDDTDAAYAAMAESIAEFEKSAQFSPFSSKYDRFLRGEYTYDPLSKAAAGKALFFSQQFTNCATCHQLFPNGNQQETFSSYEYHNIGVPINQEVRLLNAKPADYVDQGLLDNPLVNADEHKGKFKTPTLRNIAVTQPYMHNGVFKQLKTVIEFYDHFLTDSEHLINPETGLAWADAEVQDNIALQELQDGRKLSDNDIEALVCFLRTLTDQRYETLIEENGINCDS